MTTATPTLTGSYAIDASHSRIGFAAKHAMVTTVRGQFPDYEADVVLDFEDPSRSTAVVRIKTASVTTGNEGRDAHLVSADFFDAEAFPEIEFRSTSASRVDDETFRLAGDLTIKGIARPVSIDFGYAGSATDPWGGTRVGFEGKTKVNRKDWDLTWNVALETGGILVSEKVTLEFDLSAVKQ